MIEDSSRNDLLAIGIVDPYPLEQMDLARNRKPENFLPERNPLTYFERLVVLRGFLASIAARYTHLNVHEIAITPYFVETIFDRVKMYNYLDISEDAIEYISNKDEIERSKADSLRRIGVDVSFVDPLCDPHGEPYSADSIRGDLLAGDDVRSHLEPVVYDWMLRLDLLEKMRKRIIQRRSVVRR